MAYDGSMAKLILASGSPRRRELLAQAGYVFEVRPADVNEDVRAGEAPAAYVTRLAREKALAVFEEAETRDKGIGNSGLVVLGADTTVTLDGEILGKPADAADAARMLRRLGGRTHRVMTGVAVVTRPGDEDLPLGTLESNLRVESAVEVTAVEFAAMSDAEIAAYIATGEPMDKAGAYGIQGMAAKWIPRIEGDYFNVVGLPLARVARMIEGLGTRD